MAPRSAAAVLAFCLARHPLCGSAAGYVLEPQLTDRLGGSYTAGALFRPLHQQVLSRGDYGTWAAALTSWRGNCAEADAATWLACPADQPHPAFGNCTPGAEEQAYNRQVDQIIRREAPDFYLENCTIAGVDLSHIRLAIVDASRTVYGAYNAFHYEGYHEVAPMEQVRRWIFDSAGNITSTRPWRSMPYSSNVCCLTAAMQSDAT
mmetsp:Transcript_58244/g.125109  ORF Transcript_58244/g.125109 Transcript_58244/m.125109 type:complete len:206 (+) Transcript_58244:50-667(+)